MCTAGSAVPPANALGLWAPTSLPGKKPFCQPEGQLLLCPPLARRLTWLRGKVLWPAVLLRAEETPGSLWFNGNSLGQPVLLCPSPQVLRIRSEHAQELQDWFLIVMHWPLNLLERRDKPGCFTALDKHSNPLRVYHVKKLLNMSTETVLWEAKDAALHANLTGNGNFAANPLCCHPPNQPVLLRCSGWQAHHQILWQSPY